MGEDTVYKSPTDMGVNRAGFGIIDDDTVRKAAKQEIIRRYFRYSCEYAMGFVDKETVDRAKLLVESIGMKPEDRPVVGPARKAMRDGQNEKKGHEGIFCGAAIQLADGTIVTGKNSSIMHAASSLVLNAVKKLAGLSDEAHLLSPATIESIGKLKEELSKSKNISLDVEETLIALSISATTDPTTQLAMEKLKDLRGCDIHLTHMPTPGDEAGLRKLGVNLTSEPNVQDRPLRVGLVSLTIRIQCP